jgi:aarF domain-containing kinase
MFPRSSFQPRASSASPSHAFSLHFATQVLASKGDFIPIQWVVPLTAMFDSMPPRPWRAVRADLDADVASTPLGRELAAERARERVGGSGRHAARVRAADVFSSIDTTPLATASIAQVHAAELSAATVARLGWRWKGGGGGNGGRGTPTSSRRVVLKIQNEGMRALMDSDCRNLQRLASFVGDIMPFDVVGLLSEMRQTVPKEFDFLREARLQAVMGGRLAADGHGHIVVPRPCAGLTTRRLLVMERLDGISLAAVIRGEGESGSGSGGSGAPPSCPSVATLARARAAVAALVDAYGPMLFGHGLFHADPHAGNVLLLRQEAPDGRSGGEGGGLAGGAASTSSSSGRLWPFPSSSTRATPSPPRMALLDFGQVKALAAPRRVGLARLVLAMDEGLPEPILDALIAMGLNPEATAVDGTGAPGDASPRRGPDPLLASVLAAVVFDTAPLPAAAVNPLDETGRSVLKLAPVRAFPPDLFQVGRTIMILRGLCHAVGADVSATTLWRPWAVRALADAAPVARALQNKAWDNGDDHPDEDAGLVWGVEVREG